MSDSPVNMLEHGDTSNFESYSHEKENNKTVVAANVFDNYEYALGEHVEAPAAARASVMKASFRSDARNVTRSHASTGAKAKLKTRRGTKTQTKVKSSRKKL